VLPRPTSLITTYLPIFSGTLRGAVLEDVADLEAGADMIRGAAKNGDRILSEPAGHCDATLSTPGVAPPRRDER
jgi:hypothetical protein